MQPSCEIESSSIECRKMAHRQWEEILLQICTAWRSEFGRSQLQVRRAEALEEHRLYNTRPGRSWTLWRSNLLLCNPGPSCKDRLHQSYIKCWGVHREGRDHGIFKWQVVGYVWIRRAGLSRSTTVIFDNLKLFIGIGSWILPCNRRSAAADRGFLSIQNCSECIDKKLVSTLLPLLGGKGLVAWIVWLRLPSAKTWRPCVLALRPHIRYWRKPLMSWGSKGFSLRRVRPLI